MVLRKWGASPQYTHPPAEVHREDPWALTPPEVQAGGRSEEGGFVPAGGASRGIKQMSRDVPRGFCRLCSGQEGPSQGMI
jgi:hypothetical protein